MVERADALGFTAPEHFIWHACKHNKLDPSKPIEGIVTVARETQSMWGEGREVVLQSNQRTWDFAVSDEKKPATTVLLDEELR